MKQFATRECLVLFFVMAFDNNKIQMKQFFFK